MPSFKKFKKHASKLSQELDQGISLLLHTKSKSKRWKKILEKWSSLGRQMIYFFCWKVDNQRKLYS
jgi:hypothetical protein